MKKRISALILVSAIILSALCACGRSSDKTDERPFSESGHALYIRADDDCDEIYATFFSADGENTYESAVKKDSDDGNDMTAVYCCYADPDEYDRVIVTVNGSDSEPLAFNEYTDGWELFPGRAIPFIHGKESKKPAYERKSFPYESRTKDIVIYTPEDYDPDSPEKYSVIYMTDGQNLYNANATATGCWAVAESAEAMMSQSDHKVIIVGVENSDGWRDQELTPDLGEPTEPSYADGHGAYFCDFVVNTVMPYIEQNYNVYTDREHTAVCGSSSGGIESFYIAMEHPEKFGCVGALSPAFSLFDDETWVEYLSGRDFSAGYPRVYIYNGSGDTLESWLLAGAQSMSGDLAQIGYPEEAVYSVFCDEAKHNELYWRVVFPDFLKFMFP